MIRQSGQTLLNNLFGLRNGWQAKITRDDISSVEDKIAQSRALLRSAGAMRQPQSTDLPDTAA